MQTIRGNAVTKLVAMWRFDHPVVVYNDSGGGSTPRCQARIPATFRQSPVLRPNLDIALIVDLVYLLSV